MKFIKEFSNWNPKLNKEVVDFIEINKSRLQHLWDIDKSEMDNIQFLINLFTEYPDLMSDTIDFQTIILPHSTLNIKNMAPILQNIGGVRDFKSF
jgi:hypothetical protein